MSTVRVPRVPAPKAVLCWEQQPQALTYCDRRKGHTGPHSWDLPQVGLLEAYEDLGVQLEATKHRLAEALAEVKHSKAVVMAHKTWENEAVAQASNANLALNKIRTESHELRQRHAEAVEKAFREALEYAECIITRDDADRAWAASEARKGVARDEG